MIPMDMNFTWKQAESLSPGQLAIQGIELATKTWGQFVKFVLAVVAGEIVVGVGSMILITVGAGLLKGVGFALAAIVCAVVMALFMLAVGVGAVRLSLAVVDGKKLSLKEIFAIDGTMVGTLIAAYVLYLVAVIVGTFVLIVPGIMIALGCTFALFVIVDKKDVGPVQALKASWAMTNGDLLSIALLSSAIGLIAYIVILPAYEIFVIGFMLTGLLAAIKMATLGALFMGLLAFVLGVALFVWVVLVMIGGFLSYALAYRKLSVSRASVMETAMRS
jgi:hypothetical protein